MTMIEKTLQELDVNIQKTRPEFYPNLGTSLSDEEIKELEEKYKVQLPENLKSLYQWKNGQADGCYEAFVNNSMFIPLDQALDTAQELTSMIGFDFEIDNWWNEKWIPIFHNGGGDYICYDTGGLFTGQAGQLIEFWHADNDRNVISPNLEVFIQTLNSYLNTISAANPDEFYSIKKKIDNYPKRFKLDN